MFALKVVWYRLVMWLIKVVSFLMPQGKPLLLSGCGSSIELARTVARFGHKRVLIVTDTVLRELGVLNPIITELETLVAGIEEITGNSLDVDEVMSIVKSNGGVDSLRMSFYEQGDLEDDRVWDMWRIEGPSFVWHFRGSPHVHAYINISEVPSVRS